MYRVSSVVAGMPYYCINILCTSIMSFDSFEELDAFIQEQKADGTFTWKVYVQLHEDGP